MTGLKIVDCFDKYRLKIKEVIYYLKWWSKKLKISNDLTVRDIHSRNFQSQRQQHSGKLYIHIAVVISYSEEVKHIANS